MDWREALSDIFAGYVNQGTLEEAASQMAFVSSDHPEFHERFIEAIDRGIELAEAEWPLIQGIVNKSGYRAETGREAAELLLELRRFYTDKFRVGSGYLDR